VVLWLLQRSATRGRWRRSIWFLPLLQSCLKSRLWSAPTGACSGRFLQASKATQPPCGRLSKKSSDGPGVGSFRAWRAGEGIDCQPFTVRVGPKREVQIRKLRAFWQESATGHNRCCALLRKLRLLDGIIPTTESVMSGVVAVWDQVIIAVSVAVPCGLWMGFCWSPAVVSVF
jgi:hypothetical protein